MPSTVLDLAGPLALLGSLTIQLYDYHNAAGRTRNPDRVAIKILVYGLYLVELAQTLVITQFGWQCLILNFGNVDDLIVTPLSVAVTPVLNGVVATAVQFFFAWRIWQLTPSTIGRVAVALIIAVSLLQFSGTVGVTVYALLETNFAEITKVTVFADMWLGGGFVCDIIIAGTLTTILWRAKCRSGLESTETILNRLIINTVETGAITATLALIELALFKTMPETYYHITIEYILGRMYSNVLLATLNGRHRSRNASENVINNFGTSAMEVATTTELRSYVARHSDNAAVVISTTVHTDEIDHPYSQKVTSL
ncbi:hypothetical protein MVEN_00614100 [Mycena venus]|uniref:DUF6534 domain-containing protein n=1 Tax=Mycena venus TaxID=2733690 RepID=A0A8H7D5Y5_9AGAR|nr:hypothetical protein MVEN_00614100 [Mycena venus]